MLIALAPLALLLMGADAPPASVPTFDQIAQLGPTGLLAIGFWLFLTGKLTPGTYSDKAEARAETAIALAAASAAALEKNTAAIAAMTKEHEEERRDQARETAALGRQLGTQGQAAPAPSNV